MDEYQQAIKRLTKAILNAPGTFTWDSGLVPEYNPQSMYYKGDSLSRDQALVAHVHITQQRKKTKSTLSEEEKLRLKQLKDEITNPPVREYEPRHWCISCGDRIKKKKATPEVQDAMSARCYTCAIESLGGGVPFVGSLQHNTTGGGCRVIRGTNSLT